MPAKMKPSLQHKHPFRSVSQAGKERHLSPSTDKNNLPLILKPLSFVSQRLGPAQWHFVWEPLPGQPGPLPLPARGGGQRRAELGSGRGRWAAQGCCWTSFRSPHSARQPEEENKQPGSWKMLSPPAGGTAPPGSARSQALPASSCHSGPGGLAPGVCPRAWRAGHRRSCLCRQGLQSPYPEC